MRCWRRTRLGCPAWSQGGWAALVVNPAKGLPPQPGSRRSQGSSFPAGVAAPPAWLPHRHPPGTPSPGIQDGPRGFPRRLFSASSGDGEEPQTKAAAGPPLDSAGMMMGSRRKRAWARSLSPLERVSRLVPEEFLSPEVRALKSAEAQESPEQDDKKDAPFPPLPPPPSSLLLSQAESPLGGRVPMSEELPAAPSSQNVPFQVGDLVLAENWRKHNVRFKKLVKLTVGSGRLQSRWGAISFAEIIGKLPGQMLRTSTGAPMLIRRPSLEEYVMVMKRGPAITTPKDISAILLVMDISQGDVVLEAGSGTGAMSLFLSRAVGPQGHVRSYEIRTDHHKVAKKNYQAWCNAWKISHTVKWPDNVHFINKDIVTAAEELKTIIFDVVYLDMVNPMKALFTISPSLKEGGICTVYFANVTQVVELLEAIRTKELALFCEKVLEVTHRDWLILPTTWKHGGIFRKKEYVQNIDKGSTCHSESDETVMEEGGEGEEEESFISDSVGAHYIAKPHPFQIGHTGFIVKLRKFNLADPNPGPDCVR